jgi:GrpB-like predicted nucleotidyltransferase (UPF0157 family)
VSLGLHREKVKLVPHNPAWAARFLEEKEQLEKFLKDDNLVDIEHIGSTSIPGIAAKPIMGVLVIVKDLTFAAKKWKLLLENNGYRFLEKTEDHLLFVKGPDHGETAHVYVAQQGSEYVNLALAFRDYLISHPKVARQYDSLKKSLAAKYPDNREQYRHGKNEFIRNILAIARAERHQN